MVGQTSVAMLVVTALTIIRPGIPVGVSVVVEEQAMARIERLIEQNNQIDDVS